MYDRALAPFRCSAHPHQLAPETSASYPQIVRVPRVTPSRADLRRIALIIETKEPRKNRPGAAVGQCALRPRGLHPGRPRPSSANYRIEVTATGLEQ